MLMVALHLYRMLTELRDINKLGSTPPVFYYLIAYLAPVMIIGLTLGIKQDVYTSYDPAGQSMYSFFQSSPDQLAGGSPLYCWLNVTSHLLECMFVMVLPAGICFALFITLVALGYKELRNTTFKQTDLELVQQSLVGAVFLMPLMCATTAFLIVFLITATSAPRLVLLTASSPAPSSITSFNEPLIYEHLYLLFTFVYSLLVFVLFVLFNKSNKSVLAALCSLLKLKMKSSASSSTDGGAVVTVGKTCAENNFAVEAAAVAQAKTMSRLGGGNGGNFLYSNEPFLMPKASENNMTTLERNGKQRQIMSSLNAKYLYEQSNQMQQQLSNGNNNNNNNITNSMSTTTTSGINSSEETPNGSSSNSGNSQMLMMNHHGVISGGGGGVGANMVYLAHLAANNTTATTNTESTCSDFNAYHYNYDFNRPVVPGLMLGGGGGGSSGMDNMVSNINNNNTNDGSSDLVDVGKILRARNNMMTMQQVSECRELGDEDDEEEEENDDEDEDDNMMNLKNTNDSDRMVEFNSNQTHNIKYINVTGMWINFI
jgi:hypothetical protein